jgi:hypothetical protein
MINSIRTYDDLLNEQQRLRELLRVQKEVIRQDIDEIRKELAPVKTAIGFIGKLTTQDHTNPLLNGTMNTIIDLVVRKAILGRAGWITKLVVPFIMKNYASHFIDDKKDSIIRKIFSWFKGKKKAEANGHPQHVAEEEEEE